MYSRFACPYLKGTFALGGLKNKMEEIASFARNLFLRGNSRAGFRSLNSIIRPL